MANSIDYAAKFLPVVDEIYKAESVTENLDSNSMTDFTGANEIKILKVATTGLGNYSRTNGYPKGDVTATWETMITGSSPHSRGTLAGKRSISPSKRIIPALAGNTTGKTHLAFASWDHPRTRGEHH